MKTLRGRPPLYQGVLCCQCGLAQAAAKRLCLACYGHQWRERHPRRAVRRAQAPPDPTRDGSAVIYGLVDPLTREIRYVGATTHLHPRLAAHLSGSSSPPAVRQWLRGLGARRGDVLAVVLERCAATRKQALERWWIQVLRARGAPLLNVLLADATITARWQAVCQRRAQGGSLRTVGREFGLSGERVRQICAKLAEE